MDKIYNISGVNFNNDTMIIKVDNMILQVKISDVSEKLSHATESEKLDFRISPSGYGIHWNKLDEDLSINGLMRLAR